MSKITSTRAGRRQVLRAGVAIVAGTAAGTVARPAFAGTASQLAVQEPTIALTRVTVIDATGTPPRTGMTVLVRGERIIALGRRIEIPPCAVVLDMPGKFVIPGLCDAHVHSIPDERISPPLYLVNGITTVREMSGTPQLHTWRDRVERGELLGPRSVVAGRIMDGAPTIGDPTVFVEVATCDQAREAVRQAKREGADFVKIYSRLPEDLFRAIADEAHRQRITFAGHLPDAVPLTTASRTGQRSIEHLYSTWYDLSTREKELRTRIAALTIAQGDLITWLREIHRLEWDAVASYSPRKAAAAFDTLVRHHTCVVPTLSAYQVLDRPDDVDFVAERLVYVPASLVEGWRWGLDNAIKAGRTPQESAERYAMFDHRLTLVRDMAEAGVPIIAGTDGGDVPFVVPGFSLHDELALLVRAGLAPMDAIRAATIQPARLLGLSGDLGTVEAGKIADLAVLDADPLADIRNTTRVHAVLTRGRIITAEQRTRLLTDIAAAAS